MMDLNVEPSVSSSGSGSSSSSDPPPPEYKKAISGPSGNPRNPGQKLLLSTGQTSSSLAKKSARQEIRMKPQIATQNRNPFANTHTSVRIPNGRQNKEKKGLSKDRKRMLCIAGTVILVLLVVVGFFVLLSQHLKSSELKNRPKFYEEKNYKGRFYLAHPDWERNGCINLPGWINDKIISIHVGHHCLEVYETDDCAPGQRRSFEKIFDGSFSHEDLDKIQMGRKISSFKLCK